MSKTYIGDSVYAQFFPSGDLVLTTENGLPDPSNTIVLEPAVWQSLKEFVEAQESK